VHWTDSGREAAEASVKRAKLTLEYVDGDKLVRLTGYVSDPLLRPWPEEYTWSYQSSTTFDPRPRKYLTFVEEDNGVYCRMEVSAADAYAAGYARALEEHGRQ